MNSLAYQKGNLHSQLSAHDKVSLFHIAIEMRNQDLSEEFVANAVQTALEFEGVADLMIMWSAETDFEERDEIIADIQDLIIDCSQIGTNELPYVNFNDLDTVAKDIRSFKDSLLQIINERGGITKLAEKTGIPQPSLSRFFNSNSMPHRSTLLKIAKALDLDAVPVSTRWIK